MIRRPPRSTRTDHLSLHDALPIYQAMPVDRAVLVEIVDDGESCGLPFLQPDERRRDGAVDPDCAADLAIDAHRLARDAQRDVVAGYSRKDRKSTRLNSSH